MERRKMIVSAACFLTSGGLFGYELLTSESGTAEASSGQGATNTSDNQPPTTPEPTQTPKPKPEPERTNIVIDDLEGISVQQDQVAINLVVGIENRNEIALTEVTGELNATINDEKVGTAEVDVGSIEGKSYAREQVSIVFELGDVQESIAMAILTEEFTLGIEGFVESPLIGRKTVDASSKFEG